MLDLSKAPDTQPPSPEQGATTESTAVSAVSSSKPKLRRQQSVGGSEDSAREAANKAEGKTFNIIYQSWKDHVAAAVAKVLLLLGQFGCVHYPRAVFVNEHVILPPW